MAVPASTTQGDHMVTGTLRAADIDFPPGSIENVDIKSTAAIAASKQEHQHAICARQVGTSITETIPLHVVLGATCTVREVAVSNIVANIGAATVTVDIKTPQARGDTDPARFSVSGADKQAVGEFAARIYKSRPPEPYKGKGVRYTGQYIRRKVGKAFAGAGG